MSTPFLRGPNAADFFVAMQLQKAVDYAEYSRCPEIFAAIEEAGVTPFESGSDFLPDVAVMVSPSYVVLICQGTDNKQEWIGNVFGSFQAPLTGVPGNVSKFFGLCAQSTFNLTKSFISSFLPGRSFILIGFSLGAASVTIASILFRNAGFPPAGIFAMASPRCGDPVFAAAVQGQNFNRISIPGDPVPGVPPTTWSAVGLYQGATPVPTLCTYAHALPGYTLLSVGNINPGDPDLGIEETFGNLVQGKPGLWHHWDTYARCLRRGMPFTLTTDNTGFANPSVLDPIAADQFTYQGIGWPWSVPPEEQADFTPLIGGSGLKRATLFFEQGTYGWSESYLNSSNDYQQTLQAAQLLATQRQRMNMDTVSIPWIRVSDPTIFRDAQIFEYDALTGMKGQISSTTYTAAPDYSAILMRLAASPTAWGHVFVRGYPAIIVQGEQINLAQIPQWFNAYNSWISTLQAASQGWVLNNVSRVPSPRKTGTLWAPTYPRGFQVTVLSDAQTSTWQVGNVVRVFNTDQGTTAGYNGYKTIVGLMPNAGPPATITVFLGGAAPIGTPTAGYLALVSYITSQITSVTPERATHRPAGRPFGQRRGRRPNRIPLR